MKVYEGSTVSNESSRRVVYVTVDGGAPSKLEHHVRLSPAGFSWGYDGDGPKDLALSVLWDHLGHEPHTLLYAKFKDDYVARWNHDDWLLSSDAIEDWLNLHKDFPRGVVASGVVASGVA